MITYRDNRSKCRSRNKEIWLSLLSLIFYNFEIELLFYCSNLITYRGNRSKSRSRNEEIWLSFRTANGGRNRPSAQIQHSAYIVWFFTRHDYAQPPSISKILIVLLCQTEREKCFASAFLATFPSMSTRCFLARHW